MSINTVDNVSFPTLAAALALTGKAVRLSGYAWLRRCGHAHEVRIRPYGIDGLRAG